jgi:hypothetical protein
MKSYYATVIAGHCTPPLLSPLTRCCTLVVAVQREAIGPSATWNVLLQLSVPKNAIKPLLPELLTSTLPEHVIKEAMRVRKEAYKPVPLEHFAVVSGVCLPH